MFAFNYASHLAGLYFERWYNSLDSPHYLSFIMCQGVDVKLVQFPVHLCFALTVHRSQGQTLKMVVFYLRKDVFVHGCLYVGLSRVWKSADIIILTTDYHRICLNFLCYVC